MDNISMLVILRALYLYKLIEKGWIVKKYKKKNTFEITKINVN